MEDNSFTFDYDAKKAKRIQEIARKYTEVMSDRYDEIRKLDKEAERPAKRWFTLLLIVGILTFGGGLALVLEFNLLYGGSVIGLIGIAVIAFSFQLKKRILEKRRKEYAPRILELMNGQK